MANPKKWDSQFADSSGNPLLGEAQSLIADLSITYTTDDPGLTAGAALTVADGDTPTVAELLQGVHNLNAKVNAILDVLEAHGLMKDA